MSASASDRILAIGLLLYGHLHYGSLLERGVRAKQIFAIHSYSKLLIGIRCGVECSRVFGIGAEMAEARRSQCCGESWLSKEMRRE